MNDKAYAFLVNFISDNGCMTFFKKDNITGLPLFNVFVIKCFWGSSARKDKLIADWAKGEIFVGNWFMRQLDFLWGLPWLISEDHSQHFWDHHNYIASLAAIFRWPTVGIFLQLFVLRLGWDVVERPSRMSWHRQCDYDWSQRQFGSREY